MTAKPKDIPGVAPSPLAPWQQAIAALARELACPLPDLPCEDFVSARAETGETSLNGCAAL